MNIVEITIQRKSGAGWPIVVEQSRPGEFIPVRTEGVLLLDETELHMQSSAREYGTVLGKALFQDRVRDAFANALATSTDRLRVLLFVEADDLMTLRWERLCAPIDGHWEALALNQRTLFSLYLPSVAHRSFPPIGRRDLRALVVVASPQGLEQYNLAPFDVATTVAQVRQALGDIPSDTLAAVANAAGPASLDALCEHITTGRYTMVHVVCHGQFNRRTGETSIFLADDNNDVERVGGARLLERLRQLQGVHGVPHFGFLAACESAAPEAEGVMGGLAQRLARELGVPSVIAMTDAVSLDTAQALSSVFYRQLRRHGEVDRALAEALAGLGDRDDCTIPVLYSRLGDRPLFGNDLERDLTAQEIDYGLERLESLLHERAPVLLPKFKVQAARLRTNLHANPTVLSAENRRERADALVDINHTCQDAVDILFKGLALGNEPPQYDDRCPFRGLYAFQTDDHEFFFGREELVGRLQTQLSRSNFLALLGASGSGKSSLVLAGLIPTLQREEPDLRVYYLTPGANPMAQLENVLRHQRDCADEDGADANTLLFVDQFEELFTLCTDPIERQTFIDNLLTLAGLQAQPVIHHQRRKRETLDSPPPLTHAPRVYRHRHMDRRPHSFAHAMAQTSVLESPTRPTHSLFLSASNGKDRNERVPNGVRGGSLRVVVTMRADFWGECAGYALLKDAMLTHQELIPAMNTAELRRAMELQAAAVGLRFEADLSSTILNDVQGEPGAMPLLQHLLLELWRRRHGRWLRAEEYRAIGGVQMAIARTADDVYNHLSPAEQMRVRDIFVRLTRLDENISLEGAYHDTRRRVRVAELIPEGGDPAETKALIALLADAKLVVTSVNKTTQQEEVEVIHEALIRHWPRLLTWLDEDRTRYRLRQTISQAAEAWKTNDEHEDFLIHRGGQLKEAQKLTEEPGFLAVPERAYIDACIHLQDQEQRRRLETARRVAQAAQARRAAEEHTLRLAEQRAHERKIAVQSLRRRAVVVALAGLIALGTAAIAGLFWQTQHVESQLFINSTSALEHSVIGSIICAEPVASLVDFSPIPSETPSAYASHCRTLSPSAAEMHTDAASIFILPFQLRIGYHDRAKD